MDIRLRLATISAHIDEARSDEAAADILSTWEELARMGGAARGLRAGILAGVIRRCVESWPATRQTFADLRDGLSADDGPNTADPHSIRDWTGLNVALGQTDLTLAWLERAAQDPADWEALQPLRGFLAGVLRDAGRWGDVAKWFPDALGAVREAHAATEAFLSRAANAPPQWTDHAARLVRAYFRDRVSMIYAGLLAAGREADAAAAADLACRIDPHPSALRLKLISTAVEEAGQPRMMHLEWLQRATDRGEWALELREKVEAGLRG